MYELVAGPVQQADRERRVAEALRVRQLLEIAGTTHAGRRFTAMASEQGRPALRVRSLAER